MREDVRVELLYFQGCPNWLRTGTLVERLIAELGVDADFACVAVGDVEEARRLRFPGSPTVRVGGRDVEPGADERIEFALGCRVYSTGSGLSGEPDEGWVRDALTAAR